MGLRLGVKWVFVSRAARINGCVLKGNADFTQLWGYTYLQKASGGQEEFHFGIQGSPMWRDLREADWGLMSENPTYCYDLCLGNGHSDVLTLAPAMWVADWKSGLK